MVADQFRPRLVWPNKSRVALCVVISLDCALVDPPNDELFSRMAQPPAGTPYPNINEYLPLQYGLRNGLFRVMRVLDKYSVPSTVAIDATVAENYPFIVEQCKDRNWEFIGHGLLANYPLGNQLNADDTRTYIQRSLDAVEKATAVSPHGWFGLTILRQLQRQTYWQNWVSIMYWTGRTTNSLTR